MLGFTQHRGVMTASARTACFGGSFGIMPFKEFYMSYFGAIETPQLFSYKVLKELNTS